MMLKTTLVAIISLTTLSMQAAAQTPGTAPNQTMRVQSPIPPTQAAAPAQSAANQPANSARPAAAAPIPEVVADINGEKITRQQLASECMALYGSKILERLTNKFLIMQQCKQVGVTVTNEEIWAEIEQTAKRFKLPVEEYLKLIEQQRGMDRNEYTNEVVWTIVALRKLAGERLTIAPEEVHKQFKQEYGPKVRASMIQSATLEDAQNILARLRANPDQFGTIAKNESIDAPTAASKGLMPYPIRYYAGPVEIEQAVFALQEGEISNIVTVDNAYFIFRCEQRYQPVAEQMTAEIEQRLADTLRESKLHEVAAEIMPQLQQSAKIENIMNDPVRSRQLPGVAALINGQKVMTAQLADVALQRHGKSVLAELIDRTLLIQSCKKSNVQVDQSEIDAEIRRIALTQLPVTEQGQADIQGWIRRITEQLNITPDTYIRTAVWPTVALKKLVRSMVQVTEEDIQKSYEATFGSKVQCRAIVFDNESIARKVWGMARESLTEDYFGKLANEYSIEPSSKELYGMVPPIVRHGGQPTLEKEAFQLQPGELSGIITVRTQNRFTWIVLYCVKIIPPVDVEMGEVRELLADDVRQMKIEVEMGRYLNNLQASASIDNHLTGETYRPQAATIPLDDQLPPGNAGPLRR